MTDHHRTVAINFCGGCNPMINRRNIALAIEEALAARGIAVAFNDWNAAVIVRLSGCTAGCASKYHASDRPGPVIAGRTFDAFAAEEAELADRAIAAVDACFGAPHPEPTQAPAPPLSGDGSGPEDPQ